VFFFILSKYFRVFLYSFNIILQKSNFLPRVHYLKEIWGFLTGRKHRPREQGSTQGAGSKCASIDPGSREQMCKHRPREQGAGVQAYLHPDPHSPKPASRAARRGIFFIRLTFFLLNFYFGSG
jgi:hypothetical protein